MRGSCIISSVHYVIVLVLLLVEVKLTRRKQQDGYLALPTHIIIPLSVELSNLPGIAC